MGTVVELSLGTDVRDHSVEIVNRVFAQRTLSGSLSEPDVVKHWADRPIFACSGGLTGVPDPFCDQPIDLLNSFP